MDHAPEEVGSPNGPETEDGKEPERGRGESKSRMLVALIFKGTEGAESFAVKVGGGKSERKGERRDPRTNRGGLVERHPCDEWTKT
jgi:hypothetical protein